MESNIFIARKDSIGICEKGRGGEVLSHGPVCWVFVCLAMPLKRKPYRPKG